MTVAFFKTWICRPLSLGAIAPSGKALATAMARNLHTRIPGTVVELGGGTGSITRAILGTGVAAKDLIVIEREPELCAVMRRRFPGVRIVCADACELKDVVHATNVARVNAVVSGLPLLCIPNDDCYRILKAAFSVLAPDGEYIQFTYGPAAPVARTICAELGIRGTRGRWVAANLPPAFVWRYRRVNGPIR